MKKIFTLEEIKAAFWKNFKGAGEIYFGHNDKDDEEYSEEATQEEWEDFLKYLITA
jgi:hypothetical protein